MPYNVCKNITGTYGAGGISGYLEPKANEAVIINTDNYNFWNGTTDKCTVNATGNIGGLYGELKCNGNTVTITGTNTVYSVHGNGTSANYGGLIGKYSNSDNTSISVTSVKTNTDNSGTTERYGGIIGIIDAANKNNVSFSSCTVNSSNVSSCTCHVADRSAEPPSFNGIRISAELLSAFSIL